MELVPGTYEHLVTERLGRELTAVRPDLVELRRLDRADADVVLSRHIAVLARRALRQVGTGEDGLERQLALANSIATAIAEAEPRAADAGDLARTAGDLLLGITTTTPIGTAPTAYRERPQTPLTMSALLVNGHGQPNIGGEVKSELASADDVDLLCAFIKWVGLRIVLPKLTEALDRGVRVWARAAALHVCCAVFLPDPDTEAKIGRWVAGTADPGAVPDEP